MKREFRVTIESEGNQAAEELFNTLNKLCEKAEFEHGITVDVERIDTTDVEDASFSKGGNYGD